MDKNELMDEHQTPNEPRTHSSRYTLLSKVISAIILLFILALDPFGLTSASDKASANAVNKVLSLYYPNSMQNEIVVVIVDDSTLDIMKSHWPLSYQQQSRLFRSILNHRPKALFIDLLYTHDRSTGTDNIVVLKNTFERYKEIPIYIPKPRLPSLNGSPEFESSQAVFIQWHGTEHYYPRRFEGLNSPAQALYTLHCETGGCGKTAVSDSPPLIAVQWGSQLSDTQQRISNTEHCKPNNRSIINVLDILKSDILWKTSKEWLQPCPYHITLNAAQLLSDDINSKNALSDIIKGKYVFFGAYIQGARDEITSPIHGNLPGVYLHSMAFDNLLSYGEFHYRPPHEITGNLNISDIIDAMFFMIFMIMKSENSYNNQRKSHANNIFNIAKTILPFIFATLMLATAIIFSVVLHYEPINWIGLSILFLLTSYHKFIAYRIIYFSNILNNLRKNLKKEKIP
ncbi:MAG: CHASE2 domain-containing protein [Alishewanella agri]|nr:CHASE2 domain-containing protein [Alishewanella agri]